GRRTSYRGVVPARGLDPLIVRVTTPDHLRSAVWGRMHEPAMRVLVIDDEPALINALRRALARDHEVSIATGGAAGLDLLLQDPDRFDVILCDVRMPDLTGLELHQTLLALHPDVAARIVFMTGALADGVEEAGFASLSNARVRKPFDLVRLREVVRLCGA